MNFQLSEDQQFIRDTVRRLMAQEAARDQLHDWDEAGEFPEPLLPKLAAMGLFALNVPEALGGAGDDLLASALAVEQIAALSPPLASLAAARLFHTSYLLSRLGSPEQRAAYLGLAAEGAMTIALAMPGPESGPITAAANGAVTLHGRVPLVRHTGRAGLFLTRAAAADGAGSFFLVPAGSPGLSVEPQEAVGGRGAGLGALIFDDVRLPLSAVLGGPSWLGRAADIDGEITALAHLASAAVSVGLAQGAYQYAAGYAGERAQFGKPIIQFEAIGHKLVDLAVSLASCRGLLYRGCWELQQQEGTVTAAMAALQGAALARNAGLEAVHILGGYGYMAEYDAQRYLRDSLAGFAPLPAPQLLKSDIGRQLGLWDAPDN